MSQLQPRSIFRIVSLLFILSGAAALIYQVVWFKYLSLFIGNTTYAQSIVLATFMGGLALGSWLFGKIADVVKKPLLLFALLQLGVAIYCFFYKYLLDLLKEAFYAIASSSDVSSDSTTLVIMRLGLSAVTLIIPTFLMGGTLPVLAKSISTNLNEAGKNVAVLYFFNSIGAVIGSFISGFYLIESHGLQTTVWIAALIDILVGSIAWWLSLKIVVSNKTQEAIENVPVSSEIKIAVAVAGISGAAAMIYEISWLRLLIPILGSSIYSFTLVLGAFISGIAIGSLIVSFLISRLKNLMAFLAWCQAGIIVAMLITLPLYSRIPYFLWKTSFNQKMFPENYSGYFMLEFFICFFIMFLPTIFSGMTLPIASRIAVSNLKILGTSVGNVFSINTLGTVIGSLIGGLLLIPLIGIRHTIELAILLNFIAFLLIAKKESLFQKYLKPIVITGIGAVLIYLTTGSYWNQIIMLSNTQRLVVSSAPPPPSFSALKDYISKKDLLYFKEGRSATVAVVQEKHDKPLYINGKVDASAKKDLPTQVLLGQIPLLLNNKAENVLIIGLGSGVTAGSVLTHPVKTVDAIEIHGEVVEASKFFKDVNNLSNEDKRLRIHIEDALSHLNLSQKKYDVIISEPSNPWMAGVGNLFTTEFFELCKERLNNDGIFVQWFHLYEMNNKTLQLVFRTLGNSFPHVSVWHPMAQDILIVASKEKQNTNIENLITRMKEAKVQTDLNRINIPDAATFLSLEMVSGGVIKNYMKSDGEINSEDHPYLEYWAPKALFANEITTDFQNLDERKNYTSSQLLISNFIKTNALSDSSLLNMGSFHSDYGHPSFGFMLLAEYYSKHTHDTLALRKLISVAEKVNPSAAIEYKKRLATAENKPTLKQSDKEAMQQAAALSSLGQYQQAIALYTKEIEAGNISGDIYYLRGSCYFSLQMNKEALSDFNEAIKLNPKDYQSYTNRGSTYASFGDYKSALNDYTKAIELNPKYAEAYFNRGNVKYTLKDFKSAIEDYNKLLELNPNQAQAYHLRASAKYNVGSKKEACQDWESASKHSIKEADTMLKQYCK